MPQLKKILVVDDNASILEVVKIILERNLYKVFTHNNGLKVPAVVRKVNPNLILLDIHLSPGIMGTTICQELKCSSTCPPILLFSANSNETESFAKCNADGFINKPFDNLTLLKKIADILSRPQYSS